MTNSTDTVMPYAQWQALARVHAIRADTLTAGHRGRRARGERNPLEDFLFEYYLIRPGRLRTWHPGLGVVLAPDSVPGGAGPGGEVRRDGEVPRNTMPDVGQPGVGRFYEQVPGGVRVDAAAFMAARGDQVRAVDALLRSISSRPAMFGCFGMHEWAMVFKDAAMGRENRHHLPLRLGDEATDTVVESNPIRCCHVDAFRFFTPQARPLNTLNPTREHQGEFDQAGCLHVNMDLYKWAAKLTPAAPGGLVLDALELALDARELDLRASPYDVGRLGWEPVPVETPAGKAEYVRIQRRLADRASGVRSRILEVTAALLG